MEYIRFDVLIFFVLISVHFIFGKENPLKKIFPALFLVFIVLAIITNRNEFLCSFDNEGNTYKMYFNWLRSSDYFSDTKERYGKKNVYTLKRNQKTILTFEDKTLHEGNYRHFCIDNITNHQIYISNSYETIILPLNQEITQENIRFLRDGEMLSPEKVFDLIEVK